MLVEEVSYEEFLLKYDPLVDSKITVIRCYRQFPQQKVKNLVKIQKITFESLQDFGRLEKTKLVWYKDFTGKTVDWTHLEAKHIELKNENHEQACQIDHKEKIFRYIASFKNDGLIKDVTIISVLDPLINKEIIVEGVHRAVAIYHLLHSEPDVVQKLLFSSRYRVYLINFHSPAASIFFPCDFLNFY